MKAKAVRVNRRQRRLDRCWPDYFYSKGREGWTNRRTGKSMCDAITKSARKTHGSASI
jgi:hypothetical protein